MIKSKNQPLISYIITIFNKEKFIKQVIEAVLAQTHEYSFEIILVNDGSIDNSLKLLDRFSKKDERIFLFNQTNKGPPFACNLGLKHARGKYIKFVDGDDILAPNATSNLIQPFLKDTNEPILSFSRNVKTFQKLEISLKKFFEKNKPYINQNKNYIYHENFIQKSLHVSNMNLSCTFFERQTINSFGGCNEKIFCPDYYIELMMSARGPFVESTDLIFYNPIEDKSRISENEGQVLHDLNFALQEFFLVNKEFSKLYGKSSLKRAASRQLNYIKKYYWKEMSFKFLLIYFLSSLKIIAVNEQNFSKTRQAFKDIRFPNGLKY